MSHTVNDTKGLFKWVRWMKRLSHAPVVVVNHGNYIRHQPLNNFIFKFEHATAVLIPIRMTGQIKLEPENGDFFITSPKVFEILANGGVAGFINALQGHLEEWSRKVIQTWDEGRVTVDGDPMIVYAELITTTTGMSNDGFKLLRDVGTTTQVVQEILDASERPPKRRNGKASYKVETLTYPWNLVAQAMCRLFTPEGRYSEIHGFHFILLSHFRRKKQVNLSFFL